MDLRRQSGTEMEIRIARWCVAHTIRRLGRVEEALALQQELRAEIEAAGADPDGFVFEEIAECLLVQGRGEEARPHFARAHALLSAYDWLVRDEPERIERLRRLGNE